ncbi:hypothetical protein LCGC14_2395350 [marine sediment metagenome]|uniref:Uncharacterized protein n=1 Tax=marine sediment metagenome TaxID=412755 RepID=A0A0F9E9B3_9ZZZZ
MKHKQEKFFYNYYEVGSWKFTLVTGSKPTISFTSHNAVSYTIEEEEQIEEFFNSIIPDMKKKLKLTKKDK